MTNVFVWVYVCVCMCVRVRFLLSFCSIYFGKLFSIQSGWNVVSKFQRFVLSRRCNIRKPANVTWWTSDTRKMVCVFKLNPLVYVAPALSGLPAWFYLIYYLLAFLLLLNSCPVPFFHSLYPSVSHFLSFPFLPFFSFFSFFTCNTMFYYSL